jgi:hypothetical protein
MSGVNVMSLVDGLPPLIKADDRRIPGWRCVREYLSSKGSSPPRLKIFSTCPELCRCLEALTHDRHRPEDASSTPHAITHLPEALRYGVMSHSLGAEKEHVFDPYGSFFSPKKNSHKDRAKNFANY